MLVHKLVIKCKIINSMAIPVFRTTYYDGRTLDDFLRRALDTSQGRHLPNISVTTAQRLAGLIDWDWLKPVTARKLDELQSGEPGDSAIDHLVAPAVRDGKELLESGRVVTRLAGRPWESFDAIQLDEVTDMLGFGNVAPLHEIDPRSPIIWSQAEYDLIMDRPRIGTGHRDRIANVAKASIELSGFVQEPEVPISHVTRMLRQFEITNR